MMKIKKPLITRIVGNRHACSLLIVIVFLFAEPGYSADGPLKLRPALQFSEIGREVIKSTQPPRPPDAKAKPAASVASTQIAAESLPSFTEKTLLALEESGGNRAMAAGILHITQAGVSYRIRRIRKAAFEKDDTTTLERLNKVLSSLPSLLSSTEETLSALEESGGNRAMAAGILHITQAGVSYRIRRIREAAFEKDDTATLERLNKVLSSSTEETLSALEASGGNRAMAAGILHITQAGVSYRIRRIRKAAFEKDDTAILERLNKALSSSTEETLSALEASGGNRSMAAGILPITPAGVSYRIRRIRKAAFEKDDTATLERLNKVLSSSTEETLSALEESGGNKSMAAGILHITQAGVSYRIRRIREAAFEKDDTTTL